MQGKIQGLSFTKRAIPIPADYRPLYKIAHILLILHLSSRSGKSSMMKLHFLCWAIKTKANTSIVNGWIGDKFSSHLHIWGIEPTVNRALTFATADDLIENIGADFVITFKGKELAKAILKDKELFVREKEFLSAIGKNTITESQITQLSNKFF
ncbi:hypothetical protein [Chryseobacterium paludis]|uniref:hypothetical protein n=1 Tax=Chryseobacterium paludis TaxID=2956784 RepID=UPI0021C1666F|nr:hypothetical protein [Chryseobacterium paludis]